MAAFNGDYVFSAPLTAELKDEIKRRCEARLAEMLGVEVDMQTMAEFVGVLIGNQKSMAQIAHDLTDFIGDEHAQQFVAWLSGVLPTLEGPAGASDDGASAQDADDADDSLTPPASSAAGEQDQPPKGRVISLKSVTSFSSSSLTSAEPKKVVSLTGGTVRSLNRDSKDMSEVLARRSQRFGLPEKPAPTTLQQQHQPKNRNDKDKDNGDARGTKRKAEGQNDSTQQKRPGSGRLAQLLGPPVNVDQAELDARDSLQSNKRKKTGRGDDRDIRGARDNQDSQRGGDGNGRRQNRRRQDNDDKNETQPPLPPSSPRDRDGRSGRSDRGGRNDRDDRDGRNGRDARDGRGDPRGFHPPGGFRGPPGYGGYPPPYGHPMGYFPPPYGMPPYGMGFPPQGMPPGPYMQPPMPPGPPKPHYQPRGAPRPFQNKKWVNPNTVKPEGDAPAEGTSMEDGNSGGGAAAAAPAGGAGGPAMNSNAHAYVPRNPYFNTQMRPRFQNKTWVRQDPAKEEELSSSLPQTPPREETEAAQ